MPPPTHPHLPTQPPPRLQPVHHHSACGNDGLDECFCDTVQALLTHMTAVDKEMTALHVYIATQHAHDQPLVSWPKYTGYPSLAAASGRLDNTADGLRAHIQQARLAKCRIKTHLVQARDISVNVSNATVSTMQTMSEKTAEYASGAEGESHGSKSRDAARAMVASELADLIKHTTAATNSVWAAVDLLGSITSSVFIRKPDRTGMPRPLLPWKWCTVVAFLFCIVLVHGYNNASTIIAPRPPSLNGSAIDVDPVFSDMKHICSLVNDNLGVAAQVQNAALAEFHRRFQAIEQGLSSNNERIDNVWEALGPPNVVGTYHTDPGMIGQDKTLDGRLRELREALLKQLDKVEADALDLKRQVQRSQVRLTSRINKLEHRQRGK